MSHYNIHLFWSPEDEAYVATAPEFGPGVSTFGATPGEALREIETALDLVVEVYEEENWPLPSAGDYSGKLSLRMPQSLHAQLSYTAQRESVSLNTLIITYLAEQLGRKRT